MYDHAESQKSIFQPRNHISITFIARPKPKLWLPSQFFGCFDQENGCPHYEQQDWLF